MKTVDDRLATGSGEAASRDHKALFGSIASSSVGVLVCQVLTQVVGMLVALVLARHFGPARYGLLTFAFTFVSFFEAGAILGTNIVITREMATLTGTAAADFWASVVRLRLLLLAAACAAAWAVAWVCFHANRDTLIVVLWATLGLVTVHRSVYICLLRARMKAVWTGFTALGRALIYLALSALIAWRCGSMVQVVQASVAASLAGLLAERVLSRRFVAPGGRASFESVRAIFGLAWPVAISAALTIVQVRIDVVMLKWLSTDAMVGTYGVALRLAEAVFIISSAAGIASFPALAQAYSAGDSRRLAVLFRGIFVGLLAMALPFGVVLAPLATDLTAFLFGRAYVASGPVLALLLWQTPLAFANIVFVNVLFAARQQRLEMWASAATTATNVIANVLLIPLLGAAGSALATLACQVVALAVLGTMTRRVARLALPWGDLARLAPGAVLALLGTVLLHRHMHWIVVAVAGGALYVGVACALFRDRLPAIRRAMLGR